MFKCGDFNAQYLIRNTREFVSFDAAKEIIKREKFLERYRNRNQ